MMKHLHCKNLTALLLALLLCLSAAGCTGPGKEADVQQPEQEQAESTPEVKDEEEQASETVTITDMAGRTVTFPKNPKTVFSASPAAEAWLAALVPERMIGWAHKMTPEQLAYYPEAVRELPHVGGWYGYTEANTEGIITMAPDVVIYAENLPDADAIAAAVPKVEERAAKLGTPVICVSSVLEKAPEVMQLLGEWLGVPERGAELADYMQGELDKVKESVSKVPADQVIDYYYAEDATGLKTESADSFHVAVFSYCELNAVSDVTMSSFMGLEEISLEQVIQWNPEYIFAFTPPARKTITTEPAWAGIQAVQDGHVYPCPNAPQSWFDRSPNPLRVLGCLYTAAVCYPDYVTYDLDTEIREFFHTLYGVDLTSEEIQALYQ